MRNLLFITSLCFLISCNTATKKDSDSNTSTKLIKEIKKDVGEEGLLADATIEKYNAFISFINNTQTSVERSYNRYTKSIDPHKGVTGKERYIDLYKITMNAAERLEPYLSKKPDFKEVDAAGKEAVEAVKNLDKIVLKAYDYYAMEGYKDDEYSKAKEMHSGLINAFENYFKKDSILFAKLDVLGEQIKKAELDKYKEEGLDLLYAKSMLLENARNLIATIQDNSIETISEIDKDLYIAAFNDLLKVYDEFTEKASDEERVEKEIGKFKKAYLPSFKSSVQQFIVDARKLKERLEKNDFTLPSSYKFHRSATLERGSPEKIREGFGGVVNDFNRMN